MRSVIIRSFLLLGLLFPALVSIVARVARCVVFLPATLTLLLGLAAITSNAAPFAYVANLNSNTVSVIDTATNTVVATVPVGSYPIGVAVNPAGTFAYVANSSSNTVSVINTATNTVVATVPVGTGPTGVAVNPAGTFAYATNFSSNTVSVINTATNSVISTVTVGTGPSGVAVNPAGTFAYVTGGDFSAGAVSVINTATNTVVATVPVGSLPAGVAVNPAGTFAYVANFASTTVSVINTATNTVIATVTVGTYPNIVAVNPAGTFAYVTNFSSDTVSVIDTATNTVVATVPVGTAPFGVAVNPAGTFAYVANSSSNTVSVINTATNTVVATVPVGNNPRVFGNFVSASVPASGTSVEFYNAGINHYFMTASSDEAVALNNKPEWGWVRTGKAFDVWLTQASAPSNASPVCRFFGVFSNGTVGSHFYTADPAECAYVKSRTDWGWNYENDAFYAVQTSGGTCPSGTSPVYRVYNNGMGGAPNHRYMANQADVSTMVSLGWVSEGTGIAFCAPQSAAVLSVPACSLSQLAFGSGYSLAASCTPAATSYTWSANTGFASTSPGGLIAAPMVTTTYSVAGINTTGTGNTSSLTINVAALKPTCTLTPASSTITSGASSTLTASCPTATSYVWTGGTCAGRTTSTCTVTPASTTSYTVKGTNTAGTGTAASATMTVTAPAVDLSSLNGNSSEYIAFVYSGSNCSTYTTRTPGVTYPITLTANVSTSGSNATVILYNSSQYWTLNLQYLSGDSTNGFNLSGSGAESVTGITGTIMFNSLRHSGYSGLVGFFVATLPNGCKLTGTL